MDQTEEETYGCDWNGVLKIVKDYVGGYLIFT
jgi:hypothetical protein